MASTGGSQVLRLVARQICAVRRARGVTQEALAERLDIAVKNVQRLEAGGQNLTLRTIEKVASALGVSVYDLVRRPDARDEVGLALDAAGLTFVANDAASRPARAVPVMTLRAAAGWLGQGEPVGRLGWVVLPARRRAPPEGAFVARVEGHSMEPLIPSGAFCLFQAPAGGVREGRVVLMQHRAIEDPETGGSFAVKRFGGEVLDAAARRFARLESINPQFRPYLVEVRDDSDLLALAAFVDVIQPRR